MIRTLFNYAGMVAMLALILILRFGPKLKNLPDPPSNPSPPDRWFS